MMVYILCLSDRVTATSFCKVKFLVELLHRVHVDRNLFGEPAWIFHLLIYRSIGKIEFMNKVKVLRFVLGGLTCGNAGKPLLWNSQLEGV